VSAQRRTRAKTTGRTIAAASVLAIAAALSSVLPIAGVSTASAAVFKPHPPQVEPAVAGRAVAVLPQQPDLAWASAGHGVGAGVPAAAWPAAGVADVVPGAGSAAAVRAGGLPVSVAPPAAVSVSGQAAVSSAAVPSRVHVEVLDHASAVRAGVDGVVVRVRRSDGGSGAGPVALTVDYSGFRNAFGGGWADRLHLVELPACALSTPAAAGCGQSVAIASSNDTVAGRLSASVSAGPVDAVFAVAAGAGGSGTSGGSAAGNYAASTLSPDGSWQAGSASGDFTYSYPMRVPPVPGGLQPSVAASYDSGAVDGRTYSTNNQPSWLGEGWSLGGGSISREYSSCSDAGVGRPATGDLCWLTDNVALSLGGKTTELIWDAASQSWHPRTDDGSRVEHLTGAVNNGVANGEYWKVTTTDGTQYYFGRGQGGPGAPATQSAWTVPVFGWGPNENCPGGASWCMRAWQWNLDYVVDRHGDSMTYYYTPETNAYGMNMGAQTVGYTRGGTLARIEYGTRAGQEYANGASQASAMVVFNTCDRDTVKTATGCDTAALSAGNAAAFPDVPTDQNCSTACTTQVSPTFWTTQRLSSVTTVVSGSNVDSWSFDQAYPTPGDTTSASLWLHGITHTGLVGGSAVLPEVTFAGSTLPNRLGTAGDGYLPLDKYRITTVYNESGGMTSVAYDPTDCVPGSPPVPASNTQMCFPVFWQPAIGAARTDWFAKYRVHTMTKTDLVANGPAELYTYNYLGGGAWAFNDDPVVPAARRTWDQWRGYEQVQTVHGDPADPTGVQSATLSHYFRGMNGDHLPSGGTRTVSITDSQGTSLADNVQDAGFLRERITYDGVGGAVLTDEVRTPAQYGPSATNGTHQAWLVAVGKDVTRTTLSAGGPRVTETDTTYDPQGNPIQVNDLGDTSIAAQHKCTTITYARNTGSWVLDLPAETTTVGVACGTTPTLPAQAISDVRMSYDKGASGAAPTVGDATRVEKVTGYTGSTPVYTTQGTATFDQYGRTLTSSDGMSPARVTTTAYTPSAGIPGTVAVTDPAGFTTTTTLDPAWSLATATVDANARETDLAYDPLGRVTAVWKPGQSKAGGDGATVVYAYGVSNGAPNWVSTATLEPNGNYSTSFALFDGFLRPRQSQSPALDGTGRRVLTDTFYDSRGLAAKSNAPHVEPAAPGHDLSIVGDDQIPSQTRTVYDGAERPTTQTFYSSVAGQAVKQWSTATVYGGDHIDVTPPAGGTASTTYTDARGNTSEVRRFTGGTTAGAYQDTTYTYTPAGQLATIKDNNGNVWTYGYDLSGNRTSVKDPDTGTSTATFDADSEQVTSTDARGTVLTNTYDVLGRKTAEYNTTGNTAPSGANQLAGWTFDTLTDAGGNVLYTSNGDLTSTTRYVSTGTGAGAYTSTIDGYDTAGRPTGSTVTIPSSQGALAGSYSTTTSYKVDGSISSVAEPALGDVPAETVNYGYDSLGNVATVGGAAAIVHATTYTAFGEPTQYNFGPIGGSNAWQTLYYDEPTRRPSGNVVERNIGTSQVDYNNYTYDPAGNLTSATEITPGTVAPVTSTQCFSYDGLDQLTQAWTDTAGAAGTPAPSTGQCKNTTPAAANIGGPAPYWQSYGYDMIGNRLNTTTHGLNGAADTTNTYTFNKSGQAQPHTPQTATTTGPAGTSTAAYTYNPGGDATARPAPDGTTQTLTWNDEDRLASIATDGKTTSYLYDPAGALLISHDPTGSTLYLPGGQIHADTSGLATGTRFYTQGGTTVAVGTSAGISYQFADPHGTSTLSMDAADLTVTQRLFDPFGNARQTPQSAWPDTRGFVNGTIDATDGLTLLGARAYDPATGRFISPDPLLNPADPTHLNAYTYANDNPTTFSDPNGLMTVGMGCPDRDCQNTGNLAPNTVYHPQPRLGNGNRHQCPDGSCEPLFNLAPNLVHRPCGSRCAPHPAAPKLPRAGCPFKACQDENASASYGMDCQRELGSDTCTQIAIDSAGFLIPGIGEEEGAASAISKAAERPVARLGEAGINAISKAVSRMPGHVDPAEWVASLGDKAELPRELGTPQDITTLIVQLIHDHPLGPGW
jgi:RHS repeat-associated protein